MPLHELKAELAKVLFLACFSRIGMPLKDKSLPMQRATLRSRVQELPLHLKKAMVGRTPIDLQSCRIR